jgi:molecular chaperone Hsp33
LDAAGLRDYLGAEHPGPTVSSPTEPSATPDFLNHDRPPVPDIVVPRGVQPFHLHRQPVRGRLVRLGPLADALLTRHDTHPAVTALAGEALALTAGLAAALKFRGSFSLQAKGDGPVAMLLADCTDAGALRGYARAQDDRLAPLLAEGAAPSAAALLGQGYLAFTCDQGPEMERYQGIVAIEGETLTGMTGTYFRTSEQLATHVHLACAQTAAGWRSGALILERVAGEGGIGAEMDREAEDEAWRTAVALAATLTDAELLDDALPGERLLHRLFSLEGLALDRPRALSYGCRCSRAKLAGVLAGFGEEDLDHMAEEGTITMTCEFCNLGFRFDRAELRGTEG